MTNTLTLTFDVLIVVRFLLPEEGGLKHDIVSALPDGQPIPFGCPLFVDGQGFDCRVMGEKTRFKLGEQYTLRIKFLSPDLALPHLAEGKKVELWGGRVIARGVVLSVAPRSSEPCI